MFSGIRTTAISAAALALFASPAQAAYVVTLQKVPAGGGITNVVANGSGSIELTDLNGAGTNGHTFAATIFPSIGVIITGPAAVEALDIYSGFTGPAGFGGFNATNANSGSGDIVGLNNASSPPTLFVPAGYVSGHALLDSATFALSERSPFIRWSMISNGVIFKLIDHRDLCSRDPSVITARSRGTQPV